MRRTSLSFPEIGIIGGTRAALGAGVALLLGDRFRSNEARRAVGWTLLAVGAVSTIPILIQLLRAQREEEEPQRQQSSRAAAGGRPQRMEYVS
jgi:hypothetical protein